MVKSKQIKCTKCGQAGEIIRLEHGDTWTERVSEGNWEVGKSGDQVVAYRCTNCGQILLNKEAKLVVDMQGAKRGPAIDAKMKFKVTGKKGPARWPYSIREDKDGDETVYTLYNTITNQDIGVCSAIERMLKESGNGE